MDNLQLVLIRCLRRRLINLFRRRYGHCGPKYDVRIDGQLISKRPRRKVLCLYLTTFTISSKDKNEWGLSFNLSHPTTGPTSGGFGTSNSEIIVDHNSNYMRREDKFNLSDPNCIELVVSFFKSTFPPPPHAKTRKRQTIQSR